MRRAWAIAALVFLTTSVSAAAQGQPSWTAMSTIGAASPRGESFAFWTGQEMLVRGGNHNDGCPCQRGDGARYDPAKDEWTPISAVGAPEPREGATAVWTGKEMIVWGGETYEGHTDLNDGARYNPSTDTWTPVSAFGA